MSSLITGYKRHELENRFKRTSALIETALRNTVNEFSLDDCAYYPANLPCTQISSPLRMEMNNYFVSQFKVVKTAFKEGNAFTDAFSEKLSKIQVKTYDGAISGKNPVHGIGNSGYELVGKTYSYILDDGSMITPIAFQTHGPRDGMKVLFDTNGLSKGPNRIGYDVFIYDSGYYWANECGTGNGDYGCYKYAQADQNPDDENKGYWASLEL